MGAIIRELHPEETDAFMLLWWEMLAETHRLGGEILPSGRNLEVYRGIVLAYQMGSLQGVALVAEGEGGRLDGVLLWGQGGDNPFETIWGRSAMGWGVYVRPEARGTGLSSALRQGGRQRLRTMGFDSVLGSAVDTNQAGIGSGLSKGGGFKRHGIVGVIDLREET